MIQAERRTYLIKKLLDEQEMYRGADIPAEEGEQKRLLRSLMNIRRPRPLDRDFLSVQDEYLKGETEAKGITDISSLEPVEPGIYLWQGDITELKCGAIVNAANSGMTGCYIPCHGCIDNCIHTYAGIQLRLACAKIMEEQGYEEPTGQAKLTPAFNLPCDYVIHTVGPVIYDEVRERDKELLASCYRSCLELAGGKGIQSVAFCCISTGEFRFPKELAAEIAVDTVHRYRKDIKVIFNVFSDDDYRIYERLLG